MEGEMKGTLMMPISNSDFPQDGAVAYFVDLHLDTVEMAEEHAHKERHFVFSVEGKIRRMLVLQRLSRLCRGRSWFLVLPITSKGLDERGKLKPNYKPIGKCLEPDVESYVELRPVQLPDNMLSRSGGQSAVFHPCNPLFIQNAYATLYQTVLGKRID